MQILVANFKMNLTTAKALEWLEVFLEQRDLLKDIAQAVHIVLSPTTLHVPAFHTALRHAQLHAYIHLGAQDVASTDQGAYTGETGAFQFKDFCSYAIVGHSERNEDSQTVKKKIQQCQTHELKPIVCFTSDKNLEERQEQKPGLYAWEDPANIAQNGVYKPKSIAEIQNALVLIKDVILPENKLIYGGSVNEINIPELSKIKEFTGFLVGTASLNPSTFLTMATTLAQI